jgi:hypothetical protein
LGKDARTPTEQPPEHLPDGSILPQKPAYIPQHRRYAIAIVH